MDKFYTIPWYPGEESRRWCWTVRALMGRNALPAVSAQRLGIVCPSHYH